MAFGVVRRCIESLLNTAAKKGGFQQLPKVEATVLAKLPRLAEDYEDAGSKLMPVRPKTMQVAVEFKRTEKRLNRANWLKNLGIGAPKLSRVMSGKREPDVRFLRAVHQELNIDAEFLLQHA